MGAKPSRKSAKSRPAGAGGSTPRQEGKDALLFSLKKDGGAAPASSPRRGFGVLEATSFLCGAGVMVLEMTGSRLVAPFLGTSLIVWSRAACMASTAVLPKGSTREGTTTASAP